MFLTPEDRAIGKENFYAAIGSEPIRRDLLMKSIKSEAKSGKGLGSLYFKYGDSVPEPVRVGVLGTGDEGQRADRRDQSEIHAGEVHRRHPPVQRLAGVPRRLLRATRRRSGPA